jgi:putative DNA primase/helicase
LRYEGGYWHSIYEAEIDKLAKNFLGAAINPSRQVHPMLHNVRGCLALNAHRPDFGQKSGLICLRNGTLDVVTGTLLRHAAEHELRYGLDFDYDPDANCPLYDEHVREILMNDEKAIALFDEFCGLTLVPDMRMQKALYLIGEGGSGKSKLLGTPGFIHNPGAITATPLGKLDQERYLTDVVGKLVCISYDVQTKDKVFGEAFTRITGGDQVATRRLYKEVDGSAVPTVRFMGSMNPDKPKPIAARDALERRLIFLPCGPKIANPDPNRDEKLKAGRAGILVRWVRALQRLYARGHFDIPQTSIDMVAEYLHTQEPFDLFLAEKLEKDPNGAIPVADITREYNYWADEMGEAHLSSIAVGQKLAAANFIGGTARNGDTLDDRNRRIIRARFVGQNRRNPRKF